jgi:hypothetical protein
MRNSRMSSHGQCRRATPLFCPFCPRHTESRHFPHDSHPVPLHLVPVPQMDLDDLSFDRDPTDHHLHGAQPAFISSAGAAPVVVPVIASPRPAPAPAPQPAPLVPSPVVHPAHSMELAAIASRQQQVRLSFLPSPLRLRYNNSHRISLHTCDSRLLHRFRPRLLRLPLLLSRPLPLRLPLWRWWTSKRLSRRRR